MKNKNILTALAGIGLIAFALMAFTGCGTAGGTFTETKTVTPIIKQVAQTNITEEIIRSQSGSIVATNHIVEVNLVTTTNYVTNITYAVSEKAGESIQTAKTVNGVVPTPWQGIIALALTALSGVLGIIAKVKSDKAAIIPAIIAGVEAAGHPETKAAIKSQAQISGVESQLSAIVQKLT